MIRARPAFVIFGITYMVVTTVAVLAALIVGEPIWPMVVLVAVVCVACIPIVGLVVGLIWLAEWWGWLD